MQSTELSNALLATMRRAAASTSALASTSTGTLPGPTPSAGLPDRYAALTIAVPPVATITSVTGSDISVSTSATVGSRTTWITPSGAPAPAAASASRSAASMQQPLAIGCGLTTTAFLVSRARRTLKYTLATGLVDGISASTTPAGRGSATILASSSILGLTRSSPAYRSNSPSEHASFLITLCSATPNPVSCTAHSAYRRAWACPALATASAIRSTEGLS